MRVGGFFLRKKTGALKKIRFPGKRLSDITVLPVLIVIPLFLVLGILVPLLMYRSINRPTIVECLREIES